jgi:hypothetical protein
MKSISLLPLLPLAWAAVGIAQPAPQQASSPHAWRQSQANDAAHTFTYTHFTLAGDFVAAPHDPANRPALVVDCIPGDGPHPAKGKYLTANLLAGTTLKIVYVEPEEIRGMSYDPKVAVRYRSDDAKAEQQEQWSAGTDKTSATVPKDSLKQILRAHTVTITADDEHGSHVAMRFNIPDSARVEQGCNIDE